MSTESSFSSIPEPGPNAASTTAPGAASPGATAPMAPGDEAAAGTPGTGENICPECGGSGRISEGSQCPNCEGTGKVIVGIGGA